MNLKLAIGILIMVTAAIPGIAVTQDNQANTDDWTHNATGCLMKSSDANVFTLSDEDGKLWVLRSKTVSLAPQVGHTVAVTGTIPKDSESGDSSGDNAPQNQLLVTKLKMVRNNCKQQ
jgi:hypothetical protein